MRRSLSATELRVAQLSAEGFSIAEIGKAMFIAESTVKTHLDRLYKKLGARNRAHASAIAVQAGLVKVEVPDGVA